MGRRKQYRREELLDRAIELFRRQGYNGTSTAELVETLGVNRKSMYTEFGSKQGLFEAALARYDSRHLTAVLAPIEAPDAELTAIREALISYARAADSRFSGLGCLLCNTAAERTALDPAIGRYVDDYLARIERAFRTALGNAQTAGQLTASADLDELARYLTVTFIGITASVRAKAPPAQVMAGARVALRVLEAG